MTKQRAHLLHPGKTGGTALKAALAPVAQDGRYEIQLHRHNVLLSDIPAGDRVFFSVRAPLDRFVSGFNSRQRKGRPRYDIPWSAAEERAFTTFPSPDSLGRALSSEDPQELRAAREAMMSIGQIRYSYWRWFLDADYFVQRRSDFLLILDFSELESSFRQLCQLLEVRAVLPRDDVAAHRNPVDAPRHLSSRAAANLTKWYAADLTFVELCGKLSCFARPGVDADRPPPGGP